MKNSIFDFAALAAIVVLGLWCWFAVINHFWPKPSINPVTVKEVTTHEHR